MSMEYTYYTNFILSSLSPPRAQEVFRQAMRSQVVRLEVVPSSNRERYEKSLIGQLFGNSTGPDHSPRIAKTKEPPPPIKAKPVFKPPESPAMRLAEEAAPLDSAVGVSCSSGCEFTLPCTGNKKLYLKFYLSVFCAKCMGQEYLPSPFYTP